MILPYHQIKLSINKLVAHLYEIRQILNISQLLNGNYIIILQINIWQCYPRLGFNNYITYVRFIAYLHFCRVSGRISRCTHVHKHVNSYSKLINNLMKLSIHTHDKA